MSKLTGPLFSLTARKTIGKSLTYSGWRGVQYVRTRVIPANPKSTDQVAVRNIFHSLCDLWNRRGALFNEPFLSASKGTPKTDRNLLIALNVPALKGETTLAKFVFSPGDGGALPPLTAVGADGGSQVLNITLTQPTLPDGWTQVAAYGIAIKDGNFSTYVTRTPREGKDDTTPFTSIAINCEEAGTYKWGAYNRYTAPDGSTRHSVALTGSTVIA